MVANVAISKPAHFDPALMAVSSGLSAQVHSAPALALVDSFKAWGERGLRWRNWLHAAPSFTPPVGSISLPLSRGTAAQVGRHERRDGTAFGPNRLTGLGTLEVPCCQLVTQGSPAC